MEYIAFTLCSWLVLLVLGLPVSLVFLPASLRKYALLFSPILGFCALAFVTYYLFRLNVGGTDRYALPLMGLAVGGLVMLACRRLSRAELVAAFNREAAGVSALVLLALAIASAPFLLATGGRALAADMSNLDLPELAVVSRFLQEFSPDSQEGFMGQTGHLLWTCLDVWFGPSIVVAFVSSVLRSGPFQLQMIVMSIIAVQAVGFTYLLARLRLGFGPRGAGVLAFLYALSPVPLFTIWQSFGGQMFAMSMMLALFVVQVGTLGSTNPTEKPGSSVPVTVLLLSGLILSYHFMVPISAVLLLGYGGCLMLFSRRWQEGMRTLAWLAAAYVLCAILNPFRVRAFIDSLAMLTGNNGWFIPWLGPDAIVGANAHALFLTTGQVKHRLLWILGGCLFFLPTLWYLARRPQDHVARAFAVGLTLPTLLLGLAFGYLGAVDGLWGSYRSFKITASFSALAILTGGIAFAGVSGRQRRALWGVGAVLAATFIGFSSHGIRDLARFTREHAFVPGPETQALQQVESLPIRGINVMDADNFSLLWTNYFTMKVRQTYQRFPYPGRNVGPLGEQFSLAKQMSAARAAGHTQDIFSVEATTTKVSYQIGPWYNLYQAEGTRNVAVTPGEGWWPAEPTHRWSGSSGEKCSVYIDSATETDFFLEAGYMTLPEGKKISVILNGDPLPLERSDHSSLLTRQAVLKQGRNVLEFVTNFPPSTPTAWDGRTLAVGWISVVIRFPPSLPSNL